MHDSEVLPNLMRRRAEEEPDHPFITDVAGPRLSVGEFWDEARRWAAILAGRGVAPGDRVVVMQPTSIDAYVLWCAISLLHAIEVPLNVQYIGDILSYVVNDTSARVAVLADRYVAALAAVAADLDHLETVVVLGSDSPQSVPGVETLAGDSLRREVAPIPVDTLEAVHPWEIACIMYTSGTTGPSKGVLVPWAHAHASATGSTPERAMRTREVVWYSPYPSFHISAKGPFYGVAMGGGELVLRERFDTGAFWDDIRRHGCNHTLLMGATANFMYRQPARDDDADNPLQGILFSPWISEIEEFKTRFGVAEAYSVFNMTEISSPIISGWDNERITNPKSCGRARPGYELKIVDDHDFEVPVGRPGELLVRSHEPWTLMAGYWQLPEKTAEAWRNQWLHTGDLFSVDGEGNFYYLDRKKDSIRRRGENISSMEIEQVVVQHDDIVEVAAVGVPDEISEEEVKVVVVLKAGAEPDPEALIAYLAERLPRFMVPRYVEFRGELPKTPTEKVRKSVLREIGVSDSTWDRNAGRGARAHRA